MSQKLLTSLAIPLCIFSCCLTFGSAPQTAPDEQKKDIRALLEERRDVLREKVRVLGQSRNTGMMREDAILVADASEELLRAELELASTKAERIAVIKDFLTAAELMVKYEIAKRKSGIGYYPVGELSVKAYRLKVEIELLREESSVDAGDSRE